MDNAIPRGQRNEEILDVGSGFSATPFINGELYSSSRTTLVVGDDAAMILPKCPMGSAVCRRRYTEDRRGGVGCRAVKIRVSSLRGGPKQRPKPPTVRAPRYGPGKGLAGRERTIYPRPDPER